jgi:hypothetical protein
MVKSTSEVIAILLQVLSPSDAATIKSDVDGKYNTIPKIQKMLKTRHDNHGQGTSEYMNDIQHLNSLELEDVTDSLALSKCAAHLSTAIGTASKLSKVPLVEGETAEDRIQQIFFLMLKGKTLNIVKPVGAFENFQTILTKSDSDESAINSSDGLLDRFNEAMRQQTEMNKSNVKQNAKRARQNSGSNPPRKKAKVATPKPTKSPATKTIKSNADDIPADIGGRRPSDNKFTCPGHEKPVPHTEDECFTKERPQVKARIDAFHQQRKQKGKMAKTITPNETLETAFQRLETSEDVVMTEAKPIYPRPIKSIDMDAYRLRQLAKGKMAKLTVQTKPELDSGATVTMSSTKENFLNLKDGSNQEILLADHSVIKANGEGKYLLKTKFIDFELPNSLYVKSLGDTLISVRHMLDGTDNWVIFTSSKAMYLDTDTNQFYDIATVTNGAYTLLLPESQTGTNLQQAKATVVKAPVDSILSPVFPDEETPMVVDVSTTADKEIQSNLLTELKRLHNRLGHVGLTKILETLDNEDAVGLKKYKVNKEVLSQFTCLHCDLSKSRKLPIGSAKNPATKKGQRLHVDTPPLPVKSRNGDEHWVLVEDEWSRYLIIKFVKAKTQVSQTLRDLITSIEAQHDLVILELRSDQGTEVLNDDFKDFLTNHTPPIIHTKSPAYTKEFNGLIESAVGYVKTLAIVYLVQSNLPKMMLIFAIAHAVFIHNRVRHAYTKTTPYYRWWGKKPDLKHLRVFGCLVIFHRHKDERSGPYDLRGSPGIFLGYQGDSMPIIYDLEKRTVNIKYHVTAWYEDRFPGLTYTTEQLLDDLDITSPPVSTVKPAEISSFWDEKRTTSMDDDQPLETDDNPEPRTGHTLNVSFLSLLQAMKTNGIPTL